MKGTELTQEQIQSAREFAVARQVKGFEAGTIDDAHRVAIRFGDLARLVAWYGAMRYEAGRTGEGGTLEKPGQMVVNDGM
jgi:hypothetical protein